MCIANTSEAEKSSTIDGALEHLCIVKLERTLYKSICDECKESSGAHFVTDGELLISVMYTYNLKEIRCTTPSSTPS